MDAAKKTQSAGRLKMLADFIKKNRLYIRLIAFYFLIFGVVLVMENLSMQIVMRHARDTSISQTALSIEKSVDLLESRLSEIENVALNLAMDPLITELASGLGDKGDYSYTSLKQINARLTNNMLANDMIGQAFVCYSDSKLLVLPASANYRLADYPGYITMPGMATEELMGFLFQQRQRNTYFRVDDMTIGSRSHSGIALITGFPQSYYGMMRGNIVQIIDDSKINDYFSYFLDQSGWYSISDSDNAIMASSSADHDAVIIARTYGLAGMPMSDVAAPGAFNDSLRYSVQAGKSIIFSFVSSYKRWVYTVELPYSVVEAQYAHIQGLYNVLNIAVLLAGTAMIIIIFLRSIRPLRRIINILPSVSGEEESFIQSSFGLIENSIGDLLQDYDRMNGELKKQVKLSNSLMLERLLHGIVTDIEQMNQIRTLLDFKENTSRVFVSLVDIVFSGGAKRFEVPDSEVAHQVLIRQVFNRLLPPYAHIHVQRNDRLLLIWIAEGEKALNLEVEAIYREVRFTTQELYGADIYFYCGGRYGNLTDVAASLHEATLARAVAGSEGGGVVWYDALDDKGLTYRYPYSINDENRLMNLVRLGMEDEVIKLLDELFRNAREEPGYFDLLTGLRNTTLRLLGSLGHGCGADMGTVEAIVSRRWECESAAWQQEICTVFAELCRFAREISSSKLEQLSDFKDYIAAQFNNPGFGLTQMADHFGFSESYFSSIFKELSSENFSTYLENYRLDYSIHLMKSTDLSISAIAEACGYASKTTFYRAFKRNYYVSPSQYKSQIITSRVFENT